MINMSVCLCVINHIDLRFAESGVNVTVCNWYSICCGIHSGNECNYVYLS